MATDANPYQSMLKQIYEDAEYVNHPHAKMIRLSDVIATRLEWLWEPYIPLGKITLLMGDPGLGKSLLTTTIAAHVSMGRSWPAGNSTCKPGSVILLSAEDDAADTIRPRLEIAKANLDQIQILQAVIQVDQQTAIPQERHFSLAKDILVLKEVLAHSQNCRLIIIDPVSAYLQSIDTNKNSDVRALFAPLAHLAQEYHAAIVCITHLNKSSTKAAYKANGSIAFSAAARAAYLIGQDPGDPSRRLVVPVKVNLSKEMDGFAYRIQNTHTNHGPHPKLEFDTEPVFATADDIVGLGAGDSKREPELERAMNWLRSYLSLGPRSTNEIQEAAIDYGFSRATTRRAQDKLGITPRKTGFNDGWIWELPPKVLNLDKDAQLDS